MPNTVITPSIIAKEGLMQLKNNLVMGNNIHREYKNEFNKIGATVSIRKPVKFVSTSGATRVNQDVEEATTSITIDQREHVSWGFSTQDLTLSIEEYSERYIQPAAIALANKIDLDLCTLYRDVWNWAGTPGERVNSFSDFALAPELLDEMAVPRDKRRSVMSPADHWGLVGNQTGMFVQNLAAGAYKDGSLGNIGGIETFMDQNTRTHMNGIMSGAGLVNGAAQGIVYTAAGDGYEQTLTTDGWGISVSPVLRQGDVFTIAGVFAVNPVSKDSTGFLQQFVAKGDYDSDAGGAMTITMSPPMIASGPQQTVSAIPADNAVITTLGAANGLYKQNMAFHKNAFALVTVPLELPAGAAFKARESHDGLSIRVVRAYDIDTDEDIIRLDVMYGRRSIYPELATRLSGSA